jgi:hypothetical protein
MPAALLLLAVAVPEPPPGATGPLRPCDDPGAPLPVSVACEYAALARQPLWPAFEPNAIPLAIYDGEQTWLFGHPHPPAPCHPNPTWPEISICPGRHEAVTANSAVNLDGVMTATLMLKADRAARDQAAVAIHEAFHAFQAKAHPGWGGNEMDLFVYPVDDAQALTARRLEDAALERALRATEPAPAAGWAAAALALRRTRFARLPANGAAYERGTELKEGLAQYVEDRARGADPARRWPADGFAAEDVRLRAYASGQSLAVLLDRFDPDWRSRLDAKGEVKLDGLLEHALAERGQAALTFSADEIAPIRARAEADAAAVVARRREALAAFDAQPGAQIEVVAGGEPLWLQAFDPINVQTVGPATVLHRRFFKLGNGAGAIEIMGRASLSEGVGPHPLFAGIKRLRVTGLSAPPGIEEEGDALVLRAEGVSAHFRGATIERDGSLVRLRLAPRTAP